MLKRINEKTESISIPAVRIGDATFPAPFRSGLEYSSPARGTWNIVHTGMLIPEAHEIFVCAAGCLRGVVLTAAEMGAMDRFSTVAVRENNLLDGDMEDLVVEGVADIIGKLPHRPPAVLVYTSCVHHFTGVDLDMIYARLRDRFPDIDFTDCYMNPIMRKSGLTPDQLMRSRLYMLLRQREKDPKAAAIIGNDIPCRRDSDLYRLLGTAGLTIHEITECSNYAEYQKMAESVMYISYNPDAVPGGNMLAERLGGVHHYLKFSYDFDEIDEEFDKLTDALIQLSDNTVLTPEENFVCDNKDKDVSPQNTDDNSVEIAGEGKDCETIIRSALAEIREEGRAKCRQELEDTLNLIGNTPVAIDYTFCPRPLGLARMLLNSGFNVTKVYLDGVPAADRPDFDHLKQNYPDLILHPTVHAAMRFAASSNKRASELQAGTDSGDDSDLTFNVAHNPAREYAAGGCGEQITDDANGRCHVLAIGQKAAYFENTDNFVNVVEGGGMIGYEAVSRTLELMRDAYVNKKDMRELVQIKGLGCEVCCR